MRITDPMCSSSHPRSPLSILDSHSQRVGLKYLSFQIKSLANKTQNKASCVNSIRDFIRGLHQLSLRGDLRLSSVGFWYSSTGLCDNFP